MRKGLFGVLAAAVVMSPVLAAAEGFYVSGHAGAVFLSESDNTDELGVDLPSDFDPGFGVGGAVGYDFVNNFRVEGEITYRQSDVDTVDLSGVGGPGEVEGSGDVSALAFMANAFYEVKGTSAFTFYVGAGVGVAVVSFNDFALESPLLSGFGGPLADDDDTVFAYQGIVGIGYEVSEAVTLTLDYRYFATQDAELDIDPVSGPGTFEGEYQSHNVMLGARFSF